MTGRNRISWVFELSLGIVSRLVHSVKSVTWTTYGHTTVLLQKNLGYSVVIMLIQHTRPAPMCSWTYWRLALSTGLLFLAEHFQEWTTTSLRVAHRGLSWSRNWPFIFVLPNNDGLLDESFDLGTLWKLVPTAMHTRLLSHAVILCSF